MVKTKRLTAQEGDRVCAIQRTDPDTKMCYSYGVGTFEGREIPPSDVLGFNIGLPCPKIKLDSGEIVWGCECWWAPESYMERFEKNGYTVETLDVKAERAATKERFSL